MVRWLDVCLELTDPDAAGTSNTMCTNVVEAGRTSQWPCERLRSVGLTTARTKVLTTTGSHAITLEEGYPYQPRGHRPRQAPAPHATCPTKGSQPTEESLAAFTSIPTPKANPHFTNFYERTKCAK